MRIRSTRIRSRRADQVHGSLRWQRGGRLRHSVAAPSTTTMGFHLDATATTGLFSPRRLPPLAVNTSRSEEIF
eukprot:71774-Prymnesium_polylepis.1